MTAKIVTFVFKSSPLLGRGAPFTGVIFSWFKEDSFVKSLNERINILGLNWVAEVDDTESDIYKLEKKTDFIVCAPGLKYQFFINGFDKNRIIYLSTMEYHLNNTSRIIKWISEYDVKDHLI